MTLLDYPAMKIQWVTVGKALAPMSGGCLLYTSITGRTGWKIYVTRQSVSNWENGKNYPDIHSLVLLSKLFNVSLDILVKGDLKEMREEIKDVYKRQNKDRDNWSFRCVCLLSCLKKGKRVMRLQWWNTRRCCCHFIYKIISMEI